MNKLSKIFLSIIIILAIALIIMTCLYFETAKLRDKYLEDSLDSASILLETNKAIEAAGYFPHREKDGSCKLVEKTSE